MIIRLTKKIRFQVCSHTVEGLNMVVITHDLLLIVSHMLEFCLFDALYLQIMNV